VGHGKALLVDEGIRCIGVSLQTPPQHEVSVASPIFGA
jgi:hypothetical protein